MQPHILGVGHAGSWYAGLLAHCLLSDLVVKIMVRLGSRLYVRVRFRVGFRG